MPVSFCAGSRPFRGQYGWTEGSVHSPVCRPQDESVTSLTTPSGAGRGTAVRSGQTRRDARTRPGQQSSRWCVAWQSAPIGLHRGTDAARDARGPRVTRLRQSPDLESRVECKQSAPLRYSTNRKFSWLPTRGRFSRVPIPAQWGPCGVGSHRDPDPLPRRCPLSDALAGSCPVQ